MAAPTPERRVAFPMVGQRWRNISFIHWPCEPDVVARQLAPGLEPDVFDGAAWIGLTPFSTTCELFAAIPVPGPRRFPETNVRTYVRARNGDDGLWFFSLDVVNAANTVLGRALNLPYFTAQQMTVSPGELVRYQGRRSDDVAYDLRVRPGPPVDAGPFETFLTGRWSGFLSFGPLLLRVDVEHEPWPLHSASLDSVDESLVSAAGIQCAEAEPVVHYARGVDTRLSYPRVVRV
jgi:uncharacterized protein YqjF (DUF2071 family)